MSADDPQPHCGEAPQPRAIELPRLDRLVRGARLVCGQQPAEGACDVARVGRRSFDIAFESNSTEVERGTARVPFVDPVMRRPGKEVLDKERNPSVDLDGVESWIALDAVELDDIAGPHEGQDAHLRVAVGSAGDQRPMPHFGHKPIGLRLVGRIVGAGKHIASMAANRSQAASRCPAARPNLRSLLTGRVPRMTPSNGTVHIKGGIRPDG